MAKEKASTEGTPKTRDVIRFIDGKPVLVEEASFRLSDAQILAFLSLVLEDVYEVLRDEIPEEVYDRWQQSRANVLRREQNERNAATEKTTIRRGSPFRMRETPGRSRRMMRRRNLTSAQPSGLGGIGSLPLERSSIPESR